MALDTTPIIAQLRLDKEALAAPIRGLKDWTHVSLSPEALRVVNLALSRYRALATPIDNALKAFEAMVDVGYPVVDIPEIPRFILTELEGQLSDESAALSVFQSAATAARITITLGVPVEKPLKGA